MTTPGLAHSFELEREIISAYLQDTAAYIRPELERLVSTTDFTRPTHAALWDLARRLNAEEGAVDLVLVLEHVGDRVEDYGGVGYLAGIQAACVALEGEVVVAKARRLREFAVRRTIQTGVARLSEAAADPMTSLDDLRALASSILDPATSTIAGGRGMVSLGDLMAREVTAIEDRVRGTATSDIVPTGWPTLDKLLAGGFRRKNLVIVAGRPAMGKSAVTLQMLLTMGRAGHGAGLFSIEMGGGEQAQRALAALARVPYGGIRQGEGLDAMDLDGLHRASQAHAAIPVWIDDAGSVNLGYIRSEIRRLKRRCPGLAIVAVDYLQRMQGSRRFASDSRATEVGAISRGLKTIAMEEDLVIVALAQLNRNLESRGVDDRRPLPSDLKESGDIEQDADVILFPYRHAVYVEDDPSIRNDLELIVAKHRGGRLGTARARWLGEYQLVEDLAVPTEEREEAPSVVATTGQIRSMVHSLATALGCAKGFRDEDYVKHLQGVSVDGLTAAVRSFTAHPPKTMPRPADIGQRARTAPRRGDPLY